MLVYCHMANNQSKKSKKWKKIDRNIENLFFEVENISTNVSKKEKKMPNVFSLLYKTTIFKLMAYVFKCEAPSTSRGVTTAKRNYKSWNCIFWWWFKSVTNV